MAFDVTHNKLPTSFSLQEANKIKLIKLTQVAGAAL